MQENFFNKNCPTFIKFEYNEITSKIKIEKFDENLNK